MLAAAREPIGTLRCYGAGIAWDAVTINIRLLRSLHTLCACAQTVLLNFFVCVRGAFRIERADRRPALVVTHQDLDAAFGLI
jgi:hypothetical protein